jgi:hypothetical protein
MLGAYPVKCVVLVLKVIIRNQIFWGFIETSISINSLITVNSSQISSVQSILTILRSWVILGVNWFVILLVFTKNLNAGLSIASDLISCACPYIIADVLRVQY